MIYSTLLALSLTAITATKYSSLSQEGFKQLFDNFKNKHNKKYLTMEEENNRYNIFIQTLKVIDERNKLDSGIHGITQFADMTQEEFESTYLDRTIANKIRQRNATITEVPIYQGGLSNVDYTGIQTTAIKNQQSCGSCWAHAGAQQIESDGMRLLGNKASLTLSVQQLVSCDHGEGQLGCMGGLQETAFDYVRLNGGITTEAEYPYTSGNGRTGKCDTTKNHYVMGVTGYEMILASNVQETESQFTSYVLSTGTLSIGVDATTWNTYVGGIMSNCGKGTSINHAVQIVGVDSSSSGWWKIRNSWAESWGEKGNIRVAYGKNTCGLATEGGSHTTVFNI
mmetsp:Transcript_13982/g.14588  ORF Transcript_13982/g.14588 Transcript_13982/m.14588 type:complete len:339 (+) Transcript_13982:119-1135(+)